MTTLHSSPSSDDQLKTFKSFPEFSKLTYGVQKTYEQPVKDYPPMSDISFAGLMVWWSQLNACSIALLNDNLVISYWLPGNEEVSGLSLIGTNKIDESICTLFDYLRERDIPPRLVHVPEITMENIEYPELFACQHDRDFDEYVYDVSKFYPLSHQQPYRRKRVKKFHAEIDERRVVVKSIDLEDPTNRTMLLRRVWPMKGINKLARAFEDAWSNTINHADLLGIECVGIFIDGELYSYLTYKLAPDPRYMIFRQAKVDYTVSWLSDYMIYAYGRWFADLGIRYINLDSDAGLPFLRMFMVALGPSHYFRKYNIEPAKTVRG